MVESGYKFSSLDCALDHLWGSHPSPGSWKWGSMWEHSAYCFTFRRYSGNASAFLLLQKKIPESFTWYQVKCTSHRSLFCTPPWISIRQFYPFSHSGLWDVKISHEEETKLGHLQDSFSQTESPTRKWKSGRLREMSKARTWLMILGHRAVLGVPCIHL